MTALPPTDRQAPTVPAPALRRLAAIIYDFLLLAGVLLIAELVPFSIALGVYGADAFADGRNPLVGNPLNESWLLLASFAFFAGFWVHGGQTLGLRTWKLRVQLPGGMPIGWWHALLRFLWGGLWLVPVVYLHKVLGAGVGLSIAIGFACLSAAVVSRLHDRLSGTEVVRLLPAAKAK